MRALVIAVACALGLYAAYTFAYPSVTVRYRLALTVEADGKEHTGAGVIQVTYGKPIGAPGSSAQIYIDVKGEAVAVDIPGRGTLFALLKAGENHRSAPEWIVPKAFGFRGGGLSSPPEPSFKRLAELTGRVELAPHDLPLLVRFRDINDPKTVERVEPGDLAASFRPGVYLKRATIEMTKDPVSAGIEKRLSWLGQVEKQGGAIDGTRFAPTNDLRSNLGGLAFRR